MLRADGRAGQDSEGTLSPGLGVNAASAIDVGCYSSHYVAVARRPGGAGGATASRFDRPGLSRRHLSLADWLKHRVLKADEARAGGHGTVHPACTGLGRFADEVPGVLELRGNGCFQVMLVEPAVWGSRPVPGVCPTCEVDCQWRAAAAHLRPALGAFLTPTGEIRRYAGLRQRVMLVSNAPAHRGETIQHMRKPADLQMNLPVKLHFT